MKRSLLVVSLVTVLALLAACGGAATPAPTAPPAAKAAATTAAPSPATAAPAAQATTAPAAATKAAATTAPAAATTAPAAKATTGAAGAQPLAGKTVRIFGVAADEQARLFQQEFNAFTQRTGIKVEYEGNKDFETLILVRVEGGNAPDIAQFAQPGLVADFSRKNRVIDLYSWMDKAMLQKQFKQSFLDMATVNNKLTGIWHNVDVKSLVWYPKDDFVAKGYKVPTTWAELLALSDQIAATGVTPWCIGMESAGATGWVGTDWVEDLCCGRPPRRTTTNGLVVS